MIAPFLCVLRGQVIGIGHLTYDLYKVSKPSIVLPLKDHEATTAYYDDNANAMVELPQYIERSFKIARYRQAFSHLDASAQDSMAELTQVQHKSCRDMQRDETIVECPCLDLTDEDLDACFDQEWFEPIGDDEEDDDPDFTSPAQQIYQPPAEWRNPGWDKSANIWTPKAPIVNWNALT
ncbi:MAG: hypothetical protein JJ979_11955 [Roseibium sp.]|nr:hypothetical protein [Roseibium sp.]